jgi:hypothetical protein
MSAPAQKSSGLPEAMMSAPTLSPTCSHACLNDDRTSGDSEFAGGLFSQAIA